MNEIEIESISNVNNINNNSERNSYINRIGQGNERISKLKRKSSFGIVDTTRFTLLDKIINDYGYGWEVNKIIFSAFLCFILNGYLTTSYCSFMLGFKKKIDLTSNQISFIGMGFCLSKFVTNF